MPFTRYIPGDLTRQTVRDAGLESEWLAARAAAASRHGTARRPNAHQLVAEAMRQQIEQVAYKRFLRSASRADGDRP
jgi:hypothetical protein